MTLANLERSIFLHFLAFDIFHFPCGNNFTVFGSWYKPKKKCMKLQVLRWQITRNFRFRTSTNNFFFSFFINIASSFLFPAFINLEKHLQLFFQQIKQRRIEVPEKMWNSHWLPTVFDLRGVIKFSFHPANTSPNRIFRNKLAGLFLIGNISKPPSINRFRYGFGVQNLVECQLETF